VNVDTSGYSYYGTGAGGELFVPLCFRTMEA
jgi:hypothetical protein